jgi:hypothetical protein
VFGDLNSDPQHPSAANDNSIALLETGGSPMLYRSARHTGAKTADTATFNSSWKSPSTTFLSTHTGGSSGVPTTRLYFTDVNGDGHADKLFWRPDYREGRIQIYLGSATGFAGGPLMNNPGYSQSANTQYFFADLDGSGATDQIYWNHGADGGNSRVYLSRY